ncbi:hypothetical protein [Streptomyces sp. NPDC058622]|uniref:hypothetical protein n=1 Tax=Streptomyces sp. NPDC058622 TaxID=3346562 RepID=UPI00365AB8C5
MFTDMKEALEAEALELTPLGSAQSAAASLVVAHQAHDKDDLADLLGALGMPAARTTSCACSPTSPPPTIRPMPVNLLPRSKV